ncbi:MAG: transposase [Emticicia sp.]|nr:transposase [Emticicia sp.]
MIKDTKNTNNESHAGKCRQQHPQLLKAYHITLQFRGIYEHTTAIKAKQDFESWIEKVQKDESLIDFQTSANTIENHLETILNFFNKRTTNANAESFNARIKLFRANLRGVRDTKFFLFRLSKLYA